MAVQSNTVIIICFIIFGIQNTITEPQIKINKQTESNKNETFAILEQYIFPTIQTKDDDDASIKNKKVIPKCKKTKFDSETGLQQKIFLQECQYDLEKESKEFVKAKKLTKRKGSRKMKSELNDEFDISEVNNDDKQIEGAIDRSLSVFAIAPKRERIPLPERKKPVIDLFEGINDESTMFPTRSTEDFIKKKMNTQTFTDDEYATLLPQKRRKSKVYNDDDIKSDTLEDVVAGDVIKTSKLKFKNMKADYNEDRNNPIVIPILPAQDKTIIPTVPVRYTKTYYDITVNKEEDDGSISNLPRRQTSVNNALETHTDKSYYDRQTETSNDADSSTSNSPKTFRNKNKDTYETEQTDKVNITEAPYDKDRSFKETQTTTYRPHFPLQAGKVEFEEDDDDNYDDDYGDSREEEYINATTFSTETSTGSYLDVNNIRTTEMTKYIKWRHPQKKQKYVRYKQPFNFHPFSKKANRLTMEDETPQIPFDEEFKETSEKSNSKFDGNLKMVPVNKDKFSEIKSMAITPPIIHKKRKKAKSLNKTRLKNNRNKSIKNLRIGPKSNTSSIETDEKKTKNLQPTTKKSSYETTLKLTTKNYINKTVTHPANVEIINITENIQVYDVLTNATDKLSAKEDTDAKEYENLSTKLMIAAQNQKSTPIIFESPDHSPTDNERRNVTKIVENNQKALYNVTTITTKLTTEGVKTTQTEAISPSESPMNIPVVNSQPTNDFYQSQESTVLLSEYHTTEENHQTTTPILPNNVVDDNKINVLPWYTKKQSNKNFLYNVLPLQRESQIETSLEPSLQDEAQTSAVVSKYTKSIILNNAPQEITNKALNFYDIIYHTTNESQIVKKNNQKQVTTALPIINEKTENGDNEEKDEDNDNEAVHSIIPNFNEDSLSPNAGKQNIVAKSSDSTMKLSTGRYKSKYMTDKVLNALLKFKPITRSQESLTNTPDAEVDLNKTMSLYRTLVQITLDVLLDKSEAISNNTWYNSVVKNKKTFQDTLLDEKSEDINDLIFSETFLKGVFSQDNIYNTQNEKTSGLPKYSHLNSNLGENTGIQADSDSDDASAFDNEPIFSDPEMYEYSSKAKSLVETILNIILKNGWKKNPKTRDMREKQLQNISPIYKSVVDRVLNIFNNKSKNVYYIGEHYLNKDTFWNKTIFTTEVHAKVSTESISNVTTSAEIHTTTHKSSIKQDKTTIEEIIPLAIDYTPAPLRNLTSSKILNTTSKQSESYTETNSLDKQTIRSSIVNDQSIEKHQRSKEQKKYNELSTASKVPITTVPTLNKATTKITVQKIEQVMTTTTEENIVTVVINATLIDSSDEPSDITTEITNVNDVKLSKITNTLLSPFLEAVIEKPERYYSDQKKSHVTKKAWFLQYDDKNMKDKLNDFTVQTTISTTKVPSIKTSSLPSYVDYDEAYDNYNNTDSTTIPTTSMVAETQLTVSTDKTNKITDETMLDVENAVLKANVTTSLYDDNTMENSASRNSILVDKENYIIEIQKALVDSTTLSTQTESTTPSTIDLEFDVNVTNTVTPTITEDNKLKSLFYVTSPLITVTDKSSPSFRFIYWQLNELSTVAYTDLIHQNTSPSPRPTTTVTNSVDDDDTETVEKSTEIILSETKLNRVDNDWSFGNINKTLQRKKTLEISTENEQKSNDTSEVFKKDLPLKDVDNDLDKLAETLESFEKDTWTTFTPETSILTTHKVNQEKTIVDVNHEDLSEILYYEMPAPNDDYDRNVLISTPEAVKNKSTIVSNETLNTVLKELTLMKNLGNNFIEHESGPIKLNPHDPNLENVLRKILLNKEDPYTKPKLLEKVALFEMSPSDRLHNEYYPRKLEVNDPDLEKMLQDMLLHQTLRTNAEEHTTHSPIKIHFTEIKKAELGDDHKVPSNNCPTIHCFVINDSSDKSKPTVQIPQQGYLENLPTENERKNMPDTNLSNMVIKDKLTNVKPLMEQLSERFGPKKMENKTFSPLFVPAKSFFYKKPVVEQFDPKIYLNTSAFKPNNNNIYINKPLINTCGIDNAPLRKIREGTSNVERFPWLGVLIYPKGKKRLVTTVVLVTVQLVIASAWEINKLPKADFRRCSKVILGHNCTGPRIDVLNYNYHPDFRAGFSSALAVIQIDTDNFIDTLRPICPPPQQLLATEFYSIVMDDDCMSSKLNIYKMEHVPMDSCRLYYRKNRLITSRFWPRHSACGKASWGDACLWRSGALLVVKQDHRWHLLGFGVAGPGCEAPSRYIDYSMHARWVALTAARIGQPAATRMRANKFIFRRAPNQIQRFGPCDEEEVRNKIFQDSYEVAEPKRIGLTRQTNRLQYNLTIHSYIDYQCVVFEANNVKDMRFDSQPRIEIRRAKEPAAIFIGVSEADNIDINITIDFYDAIRYKVLAYGERSKWNNLQTLPKYVDENKAKIVPKYIKNDTLKPKYTKNEEKSFLRQPFSEAIGRRYIRRKSLEKYKNSYYTHNFHNKMAARARRKTIEEPNRRRAKSRANRRKHRKRIEENKPTNEIKKKHNE